MLALRAADDPTDELALVEALRTASTDAATSSCTSGAEAVVVVDLARTAATRPRCRAPRRRRDRSTSARSPSGPPWSPPPISLAAIVDERRTARRRARLARRPRRVAASPLRGRAGTRLERRGRSRAPALSGLGEPAGQREPHRRHDPARARPRRRAHHDHPCRQGPRVPDHGRHRSHHHVRPASRATRWCGTATRGRSPARRATTVYDEYTPIDEQMSDAERRRLLYVACTRAVDHLVVSLHRLPTNGDEEPTASAERSAARRRRGGRRCGRRGARSPPTPARFSIEPATCPTSSTGPMHDEWDRSSATRALRTPRARRDTVSATRLADDRVAHRPGRPPTRACRSTGRPRPPTVATRSLRHGDRAGGARACSSTATSATAPTSTAEAAAQCAAEGIIGLDDTVAALARSALAATDRASSARHRTPSRAVRRRADRRPGARGIRRPARRARPTAASSSTTRPTRGATTAIAPSASRGTAASSPRTASRSKRARRAGRGRRAGALPPRWPGRGDRARRLGRSARRAAHRDCSSALTASAASGHRSGRARRNSPATLSRRLAKTKITPNATASGSTSAPSRAAPSHRRTAASMLASTAVPSGCNVRSGSSYFGHRTSVSDTPITSSPPKSSTGSVTRETRNPRSGSTNADTRYARRRARYCASSPYRTSITPSTSNGSGAPARIDRSRTAPCGSRDR